MVSITPKMRSEKALTSHGRGLFCFTNSTHKVKHFFEFVFTQKKKPRLATIEAFFLDKTSHLNPNKYPR